MDFHKQENTSTTTPSPKRMMMMMMKNKTTTSPSSSLTHKNSSTMHDTHHDDQPVSDDDQREGIMGVATTEEKKQKRLTSSAGRRVPTAAAAERGGTISCQAEKCTADLNVAKRYHRRHKVCEFHAKAPSVLVCGLPQRFCQQCSRFHELSEFDETKRSCRRRLAGHNERRRKSVAELQGEGGSSSQTTKGCNPQLRACDHEKAPNNNNNNNNNNNGTSGYKQYNVR